MGRVRRLLQARSLRTRVAYLFIDGIAERLRPGQRREAVLAAWGIGEDGRKSFLGLMAGSKEDVETVRAFFQDLRARGLGDPLLVVSDGHLGSSGRSRNASPARRASAVWRSRRRSRPILGPNSRRGSPPAIRRPRARSPDNWRPASAPITPTSRPVRSPVSRTISRPASRTCACRSRIVVSQGRRTSSNGCSSRNGGG